MVGKKKKAKTKTDNELKKNPRHSRQENSFFFWQDLSHHIIDKDTHEIVSI